jgi:hypothetical protein
VCLMNPKKPYKVSTVGCIEWWLILMNVQIIEAPLTIV